MDGCRDNEDDVVVGSYDKRKMRERQKNDRERIRDDDERTERETKKNPK